MKLRELLKEGTDTLLLAGIDNASFDAREIMKSAYGFDTSDLLMQLDRDICPGALGSDEPAYRFECPGDCSGLWKFRDDIKKRSLHIPLQHILGYTYFMGLKFRVTPDVLIPRQDTEVLAETILKSEASSCISVLDLCTGSGCIAVSLKKLGGYSIVAASDIDSKALDVARGNAFCNDTDIIFFLSDLFEEVKGCYDVIAANPPYIASDVIPGLAPEVKDFDPRIALCAGADGLDFYRRICDGCSALEDGVLKPGGRIYLEIGFDQGKSVAGILKRGGFTDISVIKDLAGLDRVVVGRKKSAGHR